MPHRLLASIALLAVTNTVLANSEVVIAITNPLETEKIVTGDVTTEASLVLSDSSATGYANLDTGILRSSSIGPPVQPASGFPDAQFSTQSAAQITDLVTFGPGASGVGYLDWQFDGTLTPFAQPVHAATASLAINAAGTGETMYLSNVPGFCSPGDPLCTEGTSINKTGAFAFQITPGTMQISVFLQTEAFDSSIANFSNTARLYLILPSGVTYSSGSGTFLADALPITPSIPEPTSCLSMLIGLGVLGCAMRRLRCTASLSSSAASGISS